MRNNKQKQINKNIEIVRKNLLIFAFFHFILEFISQNKNTAIPVFINYLISKAIIVSKIKSKKINNLVGYTWFISIIVFIIRTIIGILLYLIISTSTNTESNKTKNISNNVDNSKYLLNLTQENKSKLLSDYINHGIKYSSKNNSKAFGLNIEIKYPKNWTSEEGLRPHIVQKFTSKEGYCDLLIQKAPYSLSYDDWLKVTQDTDEIKKNFSTIKPNDLKITPTQYSGAPGDLLEYSTQMEQADTTIFLNGVAHILFYKDKAILLQCITVGNTKEISQKNMNIYYPIFRAMGNSVTIIRNKI